MFRRCQCDSDVTSDVTIRLPGRYSGGAHCGVGQEQFQSGSDVTTTQQSVFDAPKIVLLLQSRDVPLSTMPIARILSSCEASFLSLAGAATSIIFVATNPYLLWRNTSFDSTKVCLPRQNFSRDKIVCRDQIFWSWQKFCRDKHTFVATKDVFCHYKHVFVTTKVSLSRQKYVTSILLSRRTRVCREKTLSQQKWCLWQLPLIPSS